MKVRVQIARSQREYANVIVDAPSVEAAEAYVAKLLDADNDNEQAYCDMVNNVSWDTGEAFDEEVIDAEHHDDDDEEADVTVPESEYPYVAGERVYWTDPDAGLCSTEATVVEVRDGVLVLKSDAGSEIEALPAEVRRLADGGQ